jgi:sulfite reductase alpha subunit-like flavoprotein
MNRKDHKEHLLDGLRFGVFGVGNSNWHTTFQRVPRALYQRLLDLGGDSLLELGEGDEDKDMEAHFGAWKTMLVSVLCDEFARAPTTVLPPGQALPPQAIPKPHFIARLDVAPTSETEKKKKKDVSVRDWLIIVFVLQRVANQYAAIAGIASVQEIQGSC